jgi:hypothetical protein
MATISKLKKTPDGAKKAAAPPSMDEASSITHEPARDKPEEITHLQFRVPVSIADEFAAMALRDIGRSHGAKSKLFLRMFQAYKDGTSL